MYLLKSLLGVIHISLFYLVLLRWQSRTTAEEQFFLPPEINAVGHVTTLSET